MSLWSRRIVAVAKWSALALLGLVAVLAISAYAWVATLDPTKMPAAHGKVRTELFLGAGDGQALIVGFGGSEGGNAWASKHWKAQRDRFLARGYAVLAVGYFGMDGTPAELDRIALEGVHEAIVQARQNPKIDSRCVAVIGGSKGAELALTLASRYDDITAAVGIVPANAVFPALTLAMATSSLSHNGQQLPFVPLPWSATPTLLKGDLRATFDAMRADRDAVERAAIEVEKINGPILLMSATRDEMWPSTAMSEEIVARLQRQHFPYTVQHTPIDGGHTATLDHFDVVQTFLDAQFLGAEGHSCRRADR